MQQPYGSTAQQGRQGEKTPTRLLITPANLRNVQSCPRAASLIAYAPELGRNLLITSSCRCWPCPWCGRQRIRKLAYLTSLAKPNRLLTLTIDPLIRRGEDGSLPDTWEKALDLALHKRGTTERRYEHPRAAFDATRDKVPELIRQLRKRFGDLEYLRVTEVTSAGWPHYHMMLRSKYLPQPVVATAWWKLTGASIVDVRQVRDTFSAYWYLVKYLSKLHDKTWTERHVSYSKDFFPVPVNGDSEKRIAGKPDRDARHPHHFLCEEFPNVEIEMLSPGIYVLPADEYRARQRVDPAELGLAHRREPDQWPKRQQDLGYTDRDAKR